MGLRFQRRVTLFPGVRLNFSARGVSATIGPRGASINLGSRGPALNLGIPGTGISFRQHLGPAPRHGGSGAAPQLAPEALPAAEAPPVGTAIASAPVEEVTSDGLQALKDLILKARAERSEIGSAMPRAEEELEGAERRLRRAQHWFLGLFLKKKIPERQTAVEAKVAALMDLRARYDGAYIDADFALDDATRAAFDQLTQAFVEASGCARIWDVTSSALVDKYRERSSAATSIERRSVAFQVIEQDEALQTAAKSLRLQNANGADLNIYPGFLLMQHGADLALIDLREVTVEFLPKRFIEDEAVPADSTVVDHTWAKCNKDGSPDRRFRDNYQIPVAQYATVHFGSAHGLNERYMFSNLDKAQRFARALTDYQTALRVLGDRTPAAPGATATAPVAQLPSATAPAPSPAPALAPLPFKSIDSLKATSAASIDDARDTMLRFIELLKRDIEAFNDQSTKIAVWGQYVAACALVAPTVRGYFARSPVAKGMEPIAIRELNKMLRSVLTQLEAGVEPKAAEDADARELLGAIRSALASLRDVS